MHKTNGQTEYKLQLRDRILNVSMGEFLRRGIKSVRMDDIATTMRISKRTLYEIYSDKEELLLEGVKMYENKHDRYMKEFAARPGNDVIDIFVEFYNRQVEGFKDVSREYINDIRKYPSIKNFIEKRHEERQTEAVEFFNRGVREGVFRSDIDFNIVSRMGNACIESVMKDGVYKEYGVKNVIHTVIILLLRGICTQHGIERFDSMLGI